MRNIRLKLKVTNRLNEPRTVILEPSTSERTLLPGDNVVILAEGDPNLPIEIEFSEQEITIFCFDSKGASLDFT